MDNNNNFDVTKHIHCAFTYYSMAFREIILENNKLDFFCRLVYSLSQQNLAESKHNGLSLCSYVLCQSRKTREVGSMRGALTWIVRSSLSHSCLLPFFTIRQTVWCSTADKKKCHYFFLCSSFPHPSQPWLYWTYSHIKKEEILLISFSSKTPINPPSSSQPPISVVDENSSVCLWAVQS